MTAVKISASFIVCKRSYRRIKQSIFVFFFNMEKSEFRVLIKHCFLMGKNTIKTKEWLDKCYGESAPSRQMVEKWIGEFKRGRTSTDDAERSGRPKEVTTPENIKEIHKMILNDRRLKVREIADSLKISDERVRNILKEHLHVKKLIAKWVPRLLTVDQKLKRVECSEQCLELLKRNREDFFRRFITVDETWIHYYTPESKQQSKRWVLPGESRPKRPKTQQSAGKVMATVFWDTQGIIFIDYLGKGKTITGEYYTSLLERLNEEIKTKRPRLKHKKILFHQDNAPVHNSLISMAKIHELRYELLPHPPYSPDLAPCDYFLFSNLKRWLQGKRFHSNDEVIAETDAYFAAFEKSYYSDGIKKIENRWERCIELEGMYVEE